MKIREFLAVAFLGGIAGAGIIGVLVGSQSLIVWSLVALIAGAAIFGVVTHKGGVA
jgi:hypothetical protein